jgi:hypothetical protein
MTKLNIYIARINNQFRLGFTSKHCYQTPFQNYLKSLLPNVCISDGYECSEMSLPNFLLRNLKLPIVFRETES